MTSPSARETPASQITRALAAAAELALNSALRLDPYTQRRWALLDGKVISIEARGMNQTVHVVVKNDRLRVLADDPVASDVRISGSPVALAKLTGPRALRASALAQEVTFSGSISDVDAVRALIDGFEIDWEEHLSRVVGDVVAHQVGNVVRGAAHWADQSAKALLSDAGEYVRYEANQVPGALEVEAFRREVAALSRQVDQLEARVLKLAKDGARER